MSAVALDETLVDEERRAPPVSLAEVLAACRELELEGTPVTRRSVREKLGRGSMTTIHNGVTQYESRREPPAPTIDLTQEDRSVIADLGARALAIAEGRVERILAEREAALQTQIVAANGRADDAIAAAEAMVSEARRHTLEALAASETAPDLNVMPQSRRLRKIASTPCVWRASCSSSRPTRSPKISVVPRSRPN